MQYLKTAFVPYKPVNKVIISCDAPEEIFSALNLLGIKTLKTLKNPNLNNGLCAHADLQICVLKNDAVTAPFAYEYYNSALSEFNVSSGTAQVQGSYPNDIAYNITAVKKHIVHNLKYTDGAVLEMYKKVGFGIQNVRQGYTKCTSCIIAESAVITEDLGLARCFIKLGADVLTVEPGDVFLDGFSYGFLGGASGMLDKNTVGFCGCIESHRNYREIKAFAEKHKVDIISLCNEPLRDIGSIIPILQNGG